MDDPNEEEFWTAYIASTPDEDKDFAGGGRLPALILGGLVLLGVIVWLLH